MNSVFVRKPRPSGPFRTRPQGPPGSRSPPMKANEFGFRARTLAAGLFCPRPQGPPGLRTPPMKANEIGFRTQTKAGKPLLTSAPPELGRAAFLSAGRPVYKCPLLVLFSGRKVLFVRNVTSPSRNMVQRKNQQAARIKRTKQRRLNRKTDGTCGDSTGRLTGRATD